MTQSALTPAVYLDQCVWIRFAKAAAGNPQQAGDEDVFDAVVAAAKRGVVFPLSATHYEETLRIRDPRQRRDLVRVMAPISQMYTLRSHSDLVRHQLLVALHETFGRPLSRPARPQVFGRGASWAFQGIRTRPRLVGPDGTVLPVDPAWLRRVSQFCEAQTLAGPGDNEIARLLEHGYVNPRALETRPGNRLAWEESFAKKLAKHSPPPSRDELRIWLLGRELAHEYLDSLNQTLEKSQLAFTSLVGGTQGEAVRERAVEFAERVPTLRIAADMKLEMFRNPSRPWNLNMVRDIDAISLSLPYSRVVVADRDAISLLRRSRAPERHGAYAISKLAELPEILSTLAVDQREPIGAYGWDAIGPGEGFQYDMPQPLDPTNLPAGCRIQLCWPEGPLVEHRLEAGDAP